MLTIHQLGRKNIQNHNQLTFQETVVLEISRDQISFMCIIIRPSIMLKSQKLVYINQISCFLKWWCKCTSGPLKNKDNSKRL